MGWKEDARRLVIGEKAELDTLPGYWVKPLKYSIQAKDEINAIQCKLQKGINKKELASLMQKLKDIRKGDESPKDEEILSQISEGELETLLNMQNTESKELTRIKILYGVAEHNFDGVSVAELAEDILDYEEVALEILTIVEEFNRPLANKMSSTSKMSQDGSITEKSLNTEIVYPTEENQPS